MRTMLTPDFSASAEFPSSLCVKSRGKGRRAVGSARISDSIGPFARSASNATKPIDTLSRYFEVPTIFGKWVCCQHFLRFGWVKWPRPTLCFQYVLRFGHFLCQGT